MQPETARRFDTEFAPRIAHAIAAFFAEHVHADVVPVRRPRPTDPRTHPQRTA